MPHIEPNGATPQSAEPTAADINFSPQSVVTVPELTEWHVVAEHELDMLSDPTGGTLGLIGFAALGAAAGALPLAKSAWVTISQGKALGSEESTALVEFMACAPIAILCLILFFSSKRKKADLKETIRSRPKRRGGSEVNG